MLPCTDLPLLVIVLLTLPSTSTGSCSETGWFGNKCQFMCHCKYKEECERPTGTCTGPCERGWFGPACQYVSAEFTPLTRRNRVDLKSWQDRNHNTCQRTSFRQDRVSIKLKETFAVTWLRIVGKNAEHISKIQIESKASLAYSCRTAKLDSKTMDFICADIGVTDTIFLSNLDGIKVCEIYISKESCDCGRPCVDPPCWIQYCMLFLYPAQSELEKERRRRGGRSIIKLHGFSTNASLYF
ncbi:fibrinogen-related molecule [Plakobranchus ocellatus]|uniref:Fibrinogen-related molecule n=1 Tax=Plakobranchus ocellatus TaxID=259542 RepID=A0AAV3YGJ4_9GAST|nr:fibrinogen-related molecule [Plakobranchus ocellatus]